MCQMILSIFVRTIATLIFIVFTAYIIQIDFSVDKLNEAYNSTTEVGEIMGKVIGVGQGIDLASRHNNILSCPQRSFTLKHYCDLCHTSQMAYRHALNRELILGQSVPISHVFAKGFNRWVLNEDGSCVNEIPMTAWKCYMQRGFCELIGHRCYSAHNPFTGHLYAPSICCF